MNAPPELHKQAVDLIWGRWRFDGETLVFTEISQVCNMRGNTEETQDQVMVRVVPCFLGHQVLEQNTVCAKDVVGPGAHLPSSMLHKPRRDILQQRLVLWEEV